MWKKTKNIIIWDWDDTLLCSSYLSGEGLNLNSRIETASRELLVQLEELQKSMIAVICLAASYGEVHIVTNAETGWVQMSAQKFVPAVVPYLDRCEILSARSTYECMHPESPLKWKFYAFQERLMESLADTAVEKNILSFGDSHVEREAIRAVTRGHPNCRTKSIKFAERPSIEQLQRQIELVTNCFQYIHDHDGDLDLCMSLSVGPQPDQPYTEEQQKYQEQSAIEQQEGSPEEAINHRTRQSQSHSNAENINNANQIHHQHHQDQMCGKTMAVNAEETVMA